MLHRPAERVLHSPSFTFYSDSSRGAGKDAEKNRQKWNQNSVIETFEESRNKLSTPASILCEV